MAQQIPQYIVAMMAERAWRMQHYLWHEVRNSWLFYDEPTRQALRNLEWEPPRPARRPRQDGSPEVVLDNNSGEDFLYMHREMIKAVNERLAGDPQYPRVEGWTQVPRPADQDYPVPPAWDTGDAGFNTYLQRVKSDATFQTDFLAWEARYTDEAQLRQMSLGEFGARIEFTIHNQMHMRWCAEPAATGIKPDPDPANPNAIDLQWDDPAYDWLGDTYSSHVNSIFWKLHGWVDDRINDWAAANNVTGPIPWQGTWVGKMPTHPVPHSFVTVLAERAGAIDMRGHRYGDIEELVEVVRLIARTGKFCHFYDEVAVP
ncbi:MAG: Tat pathway signal protein [Desulfomonile tiedjei]|nr:Tat pathway signal protein [Desulfomonile tiedjei]